ncbi:hypothetical protein K501DRAFT_220231 [Backusella circina FSU 941]|nr:hypothetical protein K501DRAFT_220231 [Backusella circina FSU 941]
MIPRLPPALIALLGGATVYGFKYMMDRYEPKAIGPPGSHEHVEKVFQYRRRFKRAGYAAAATGVIFAGYWLYESRVHRPTPAISQQNDSNKNDFYQDQYGERDKRQYQERMERMKMEREKEQLSRKRLEDEVELMKKIAQDSNHDDKKE